MYLPGKKKSKVKKQNLSYLIHLDINVLLQFTF